MASFLKSHFGIILVITLFLLLGALRLNDLSFYTPDSCRYLVWGNSIAHGKGFVDDTQPVPERFVINAPLYAVLISPVEALFPLSIIAVKVWTLLLAALAVGLLYYWLSAFHGRSAALIGSILFAFNPALLFLSTEVLSEAPFLAAIMLTMLLAGLADLNGRPVNKFFILILICTPSVVLLRETGVALAGALVVYYLLRRKWLKSAVLLAIPSLVYFFWYLRNSYWASFEGKELETNLTLATKHFVTPENAPLALEFLKRIWSSLHSYAVDIGGRLFYPLSSSQLTGLFRVNASELYTHVSNIVSGSVFMIVAVAAALMIAGCIRDIRKPAFWLRLSFVLLYLLVISLYPVRDIRFLLPLLPFMVYYLVGGIRSCADWGKKFFRVPGWAGAVVAVLVMLPNLLGIGQVIALNITYCRTPGEVAKIQGLPVIYRYEWRKVGEWIQANVPESSVIASPVKDLVIVSGGRKVLEIDPGVPLPAFDNFLRDYNVGYIFASARWSDLRDYEFLMRESRRFWFEPVMAVPSLMKVHSRLLEPRITVSPHKEFDTTRASELLRFGRASLIGGDYETALKILSRALDRTPQQPAVLYQLLVAEMMRTDTASVPKLYERLLAVPQSLSYTEMARAQWEAYRLVVESEQARDTGQKISLRAAAARLYWDLGYYNRAAGLLDNTLAWSSKDFSVVATGVLFNLQNGDTVMARRFLAQLNALDHANPVTRNFDTLFMIHHALLSEPASPKRSNEHLQEARIYFSLGFPAETLDEAERSLADNPGNSATLEFLARYYDARRNFYQTVRYCRMLLSFEPENLFARSMIDSLNAGQ